jgi:hypothetical protein
VGPVFLLPRYRFPPPIWVKNVKPLQFFITPAKLLSPFRGQLAVDLLWAPEPLNGATGPNTDLNRPTGSWQGLFIGSLLAVYPGAARSEFWTARVDPSCRQLGRGMKASFQPTNLEEHVVLDCSARRHNTPQTRPPILHTFCSFVEIL